MGSRGRGRREHIVEGGGGQYSRKERSVLPHSFAASDVGATVTRRGKRENDEADTW